MTASAYIEALRERFGIRLRLQKNGKLRTMPKGTTLPISAKQMLVGFRHQVVAFLKDGTDQTLDLDKSRAFLESVGFKVLDDVPGRPLCHPDGDEVGDEILVGILSSEEAQASAKARDARGRREGHRIQQQRRYR